MNIKPLSVPFFKSEPADSLLRDLDAMKRTHSMRVKRLKKILKDFGLLGHFRFVGVLFFDDSRCGS